MKRVFAIGAICCALALAVSAQSKSANFAGTWELDKAKSELPGPMGDSIKSATRMITQDDKQITSEQKIERAEGAGGPPPGRGPGGGRGMGMMGAGGPMTIKLDGSETTTESPRGKSTMKAKWTNGGKTLEINTIRNMSTPNGDFSFTTVEHWELSEDGKTLKVHQSTETPNGTREMKWVYTKK